MPRAAYCCSKAQQFAKHFYTNKRVLPSQLTHQQGNTEVHNVEKVQRLYHTTQQ